MPALAQFPYNLYGIFLCLLALGLLVFLLMRMGVDRNGEVFDKERNLNYSQKGTYGTSGFMTPDEMYRVLELTDHAKKTKGTILGKLNGKAVSHPAKVPYCIYKQASDTVRSGVIIGLGARLQVFQNKLIRQITSYDEIDLILPGKQPSACSGTYPCG